MPEGPSEAGGAFGGTALDSEETGATDAPDPVITAASAGAGIPAGAAIGAAVGNDVATRRREQREDEDATAMESSDPRPR